MPAASCPNTSTRSKAAIFKDDPFQTLDVEGVGMLIEWAIAKGRETRPKLKIGICGEHGGDAESVKFCHQVGMNYVSASPFRVPIAAWPRPKRSSRRRRRRKSRSGSAVRV